MDRETEEFFLTSTSKQLKKLINAIKVDPALNPELNPETQEFMTHLEKYYESKLLEEIDSEMEQNRNKMHC